MRPVFPLTFTDTSKRMSAYSISSPHSLCPHAS